ncbi:SdpI/YhfL family protein [Tenacibaculum gallaicum]|uniref:SdpI/YhfL family protein n=1 Tax=Tenacibaculum gallaicum TaxID=561505 RepID=A0A3E0IBZ8_9FLAO|nr:SdpI family protein [Tenacibaculum gallaicum]REH56149.1 SdpI/YhfL family protein [Tenacibaculum gallaicum]
MNPFYYVLSINGLLFLFSIIFYFFPPKKINAIYGYRTNKTMKNDTIWQFANTFFTKEFMKYSAISLVAALVLASISKELTWQPMAIMLLSLAVSVVKTEQEINKNFDEDGNSN